MTFQEYLFERLNCHSGSFIIDMKILFSNMKDPPLMNVKCHSDSHKFTVTFQPIRMFTNFMTLIPSLTITELRVVYIWHLQRVLDASRERLPFQTPGSVPFWGLTYVLIVETNFTQNLPCLLSIFHLVYPSVLDFAKR